MGLPTGWTVEVSAIQAQFGQGGSNPMCAIHYRLLNESGSQVGSDVHVLRQNPSPTTDAFAADGTTTAFTTSQVPYAGSTVEVLVRVKKATQATTADPSSYSEATNTDGAVTVTFATAPAKDEGVTLNYTTGPSLANAAGDLPSVLGLSSSSGTVYAGTVNGKSAQTSHQSVVEIAAVLLSWAQARVEADKF